MTMSLSTRFVMSALALVAAACAPDGPDGPTAGVVTTAVTPDSSTSLTTESAISTTTGTPPVTVPQEQVRDPDPAPGRPQVSIEPVDLEVLEPVAALTDVLAAPDGSGLWIIEQRGLIRRLGTAGEPVVLDITDRTTADGERGLLGVVLVDDGRRIVVDYTAAESGDTVIEMFDIGPDGTAVQDSGTLLLRIAQPFANHNGGDLEALDDGTILVATGDGGSAGDPGRVAHRLDDPLGKILRLAPVTDPAGRVPADNPWVDSGDADPLVWASGLRNPWRIDVDPLTGDLWVADVGQAALEEVSVAEAGDAVVGGAGADFGWSAREGDEAYNIDVTPDPRTIPVEPVHTYPHEDGECSITGGVVYRGSAVPGLWGWYVFADHCSGRVRALDRRRGEVVDLGVVERPTAIERGPGGEVFVATGGGEVFSVGRP
jgi:glucose/arabinose dehydrogenase